MGVGQTFTVEVPAGPPPTSVPPTTVPVGPATTVTTAGPVGPTTTMTAAPGSPGGPGSGSPGTLPRTGAPLLVVLLAVALALVVGGRLVLGVGHRSGRRVHQVDRR